MDKRAILNLTQHHATTDQMNAGVIDLPEDQREELVRLLTFDRLPDSGEVQQRAANIAGHYLPEWIKQLGLEEIDTIMIGGAPYLMCPLERYLTESGMKPVYAYSERESYDEKQPDGNVRKVNIFRHTGFIKASYNQGWPKNAKEKPVYVYEWDPKAGPLPAGAIDCSADMLGDDILDTDWDGEVEDQPHDRIYAEVDRRAAEATAKITAQQGETSPAFLVETGAPIGGKQYAVVVDMREGIAYPPAYVESILARGYWEDLQPQDAKTSARILMLARQAFVAHRSKIPGWSRIR